MGSLRPDPSSTGCCRPWVLHTRGHSWAAQADLVPVSVGDTVGSSSPAARGESCCENKDFSSKTSMSEKTGCENVPEEKRVRRQGS